MSNKPEMDFKIFLLSEARDFLNSLDYEAYLKVQYNIRKVLGGIRDAELFKKLENTNIWEFRTLHKGKSYRLFAFWDNDEQKLIVATHGILKKTQKTPRKEIKKAEKLREEYFNNKK